MKQKTCCFTGHRKLPVSQLDAISKRVEGEIVALQEKGVFRFISGGALGFDQLAAQVVVARKELGDPIQLVMALPCMDQDAFWSPTQRERYRELLALADEVICLSEAYDKGCMYRRNAYMVEQSGVCICALQTMRTGTAQTVRLAKEKGLAIINVLEKEPNFGLL